MKLTDDLPKWVALPLRLALYAFVMFILFTVAYGIVIWRVANNSVECSDVVSSMEGGLKYAKGMVVCLRQKNGFLENLAMGSVYRAIDAMPNVPQEFVGTWDASQPRCSYRHKLGENGEFNSEPRGCSLSADIFHGVWGVYDNQLIWLPDEGVVWPPEINPMDVIDNDFFLLVEKDGSRTKFSRVASDPVSMQTDQGLKGQVEALPVEKIPADMALVTAPLRETLPNGEFALPDMLHLDEGDLVGPMGKEFDKATVNSEGGFNNLLSDGLIEKVHKVFNGHGHDCNLYPAQIYYKQDVVEKIVETSCFDQRNGFSEYPVILSISDDSVRELAEMNKYGFMYQSGSLKAVTDSNNNGRLELWLEGAICECDGEDNEPCDCTGTTVVEVPSIIVEK